MKRILTALVVLPGLLLYVHFLSEIWFLLLVLLVAILAFLEFSVMAGIGGPLRIAALAGALLPIGNAFHPVMPQANLMGAVFIVLALVRLFSPPHPEGGLKDIGYALLGVVYVGGLLASQVMLRAHGSGAVFLLYGTVWASDTCALYVGSGLGRHKLHPRMSPKKTVEGSLAGLAGAAAAALVLNIPYAFMSPLTACGVGVALSAAGQAGDLVESMFKRDAGVKDSGALFPGHGGILDKIDAALMAGPVLWFVLSFLGVPS